MQQLIDMGQLHLNWPDRFFYKRVEQITTYSLPS